MRHWIATTALTLLFAGAAAADPAYTPPVASAEHWTQIEQQLDADLQRKIDANTQRALRNHMITAEAVRGADDCDPVRVAAASQNASATEQHRRLSECLAQRRANEALLAGH
jgi:hypothetical protein